jgi:hypothetical protein
MTENQMNRIASENLQKICLVSCVSVKLGHSAEAQNLVTKTGQPWFILSAKYGFIQPDEIISPYDETLNRMNTIERRRWADRVKAQMDARLPNANEIVVLAGVKY